MNKIYQKPFPGVKNAFNGLFGALRIKSHSRGVLSGIFRRDSSGFCCINGKNNEDPRQNPSGMTTSFHQGAACTGFTLIELLVVVLIIGILSAIALPQYQKAVRRAHSSQMLILARSLKDAQERHWLADSSYTMNFEELDVQMPSSCIVSGQNVTCKKSGYEVNISLSPGSLTHPHHRFLVMRENSYPYIFWQYQLDQANVLPGKKLCFPRTQDGAAGAAFCKSFGGAPTSAYAGWWPGFDQGFMVL